MINKSKLGTDEQQHVINVTRLGLKQTIDALENGRYVQALVFQKIAADLIKDFLIKETGKCTNEKKFT